MKAVGVAATIVGIACLAAGALGASVPFSMPWEGVGRGFMAYAFAVSVASAVVGLNVLRGGIETAQGRASGAERLAAASRWLAALAVAAGIGAGMRVASAGTEPRAAWLGATLVSFVGAACLALAAGRALRRGRQVRKGE